MSVFPYKTWVQIIVASIVFHNYIRRNSIQDVAFNKSERHPDFVPQDFLRDVVPWSQTYEGNSTSHMDYVQDRIASSLMGEL